MNETNEMAPKGRKPRRKVDQAFRDRAVELSMQPGRQVRELAAELGISDPPIHYLVGTPKARLRRPEDQNTRISLWYRAFGPACICHHFRSHQYSNFEYKCACDCRGRLVPSDSLTVCAANGASLSVSISRLAAGIFILASLRRARLVSTLSLKMAGA